MESVNQIGPDPNDLPKVLVLHSNSLPCPSFRLDRNSVVTLKPPRSISEPLTISGGFSVSVDQLSPVVQFADGLTTYGSICNDIVITTLFLNGHGVGSQLAGRNDSGNRAGIFGLKAPNLAGCCQYLKHDRSKTTKPSKPQTHICQELPASSPNTYHRLLNLGWRGRGSTFWRAAAEHRIAIGRSRRYCLMRPTCALDVESDLIVQQALDKMASNRTKFCGTAIIHYSRCDTIIVLNSGQNSGSNPVKKASS
ncbi:hypothetical protein F3Y22_tig00000132pilonHSYRG00020 [Hibiscus syriacus]|uniref:Uncharacterized protein n=1 Tax=Hibiscus syriacus TaxID=106335 RepID=A0A6A3D312_HIBSY|nr:hypothetical protein F3Y22_tig00000132pilonHSYRG00020 [Hibiscus syriacus]